jgi:polysaccharide pyruvyl transferase WcaK-like protein
VNNYSTLGAAVYDVHAPVADAFAEQTGRPYRSAGNRVTPGHTRELDALMKKYAAADLMVSSTLHGFIPGVSVGKKVLAISGEYKIEEFMNVVGLGDWLLSQEDVRQIRGRREKLRQQASADEHVCRVRQQHRRIANEVLRLAGSQKAE